MSAKKKLLYSGRVEKHAVSSPEWKPDSDILNIRIVRYDDDTESLHIETMDGQVRALIKLDKRQAESLLRCMWTAMDRWEEKEI